MMSPHLPIVGPPHEWFALKGAIHYSGRTDRTLRTWVKIHGIGRQSGKNARIEISKVALEMVLFGDFDALELLRAGKRSHPRVRHYLDRLMELGVLPTPKVILAEKLLPTNASANCGPQVLLSDYSSGPPGDPVALDITPSFEREIEQMRDEGPHARIAERIRAILRSEEGQFLPNLANVLAFDLDLSASESLRILEVAAKDKRARIQ
jgi:hypothetical protein